MEPAAEDASARDREVVASRSEPVEPTEFEHAITASLSSHRLRDQYLSMWDALSDEAHGKPPIVIGFVSVGPDEHVANVVAHLGSLVSQELGQHVLLVDGDLRKRYLSSAFDMLYARGLAESCLLECDWNEVVTPTSNRRLCVLPTGEVSIGVIDVDARRLSTTAKSWKEMFDVTLVDIGDAQAPFARAMYGVCDRIYLLVRLGQTDREIADSVVQLLLEQQISLKGCIATNLP